MLLSATSGRDIFQCTCELYMSERERERAHVLWHGIILNVGPTNNSQPSLKSFSKIYKSKIIIFTN